MQYYRLYYKQKGQSLLWVIGFLATMAVTFAGVYSVGQTTNEKQKIVNAADAAAYTGAMVEARALNLTAYANRADIANEVFLAQMVSMQSWVDYMKTSAENWKTVAQALSWIPPVAAVASALEAIENALSAAADVMKDVTMPATIFAVEAYYKVMDTALKGVFGGTGAVNMAISTQSAANAVLAANVATGDGSKLDTAATAVAVNTVALQVLNGMEWKKAFHRYDSSTGEDAGSATDDGRRNTRDILLASRDEFSNVRKGPNNPFEIFFGNFKFGSCPIAEFGVSRDGTTKLKDYERWEAQDTTEYYIATGAKCKKTGIPMGWGRSTAANEETSGDIKTDVHSWGGQMAYYDDPKKNEKWTGVKALWDVSRDSNDYPVDAFKPGEETLTFTVAVAKRKADIRNNEHASLNFMNTANTTSRLGSADAKADYLDGQISAKSEAKVFFSRPARNNQDFTGIRLFREDNHKEIASLYNPYWQVRLKNVNTNPFNMSTKDLAKITAIYGANLPLAPFSQ